ncbi:MAG: CBS domain-containing protein [Nocardioides sp.]|nr:CBS domain-containing protein [Nocardioides sp.]
MLVREVMTLQVVSVHPDTSLKNAIAALDRHEVTSMPVIDTQGRLVGVVSEADVIRDAVLPGRRGHEIPIQVSSVPASLRVADVMTHLPLTVGPDDDLAEAVDLLVSTQVKSLPVVDHDRVVGMVSRRDVIAVLARNDALIESEVDDLLRSGDVECQVEVADGVVHLSGSANLRSREIARTLAASVPGVVAVGFDD